MENFKQMFCKHNWIYLQSNNIVNEQLKQCLKCKLYKIFHRGIGCQYTTKDFPKNKGWRKK